MRESGNGGASSALGLVMGRFGYCSGYKGRPKFLIAGLSIKILDGEFALVLFHLLVELEWVRRGASPDAPDSEL